MINWRVRIKNKLFWLALIPALLVLIRTVAAVAGINIDLSDLAAKLTAVIEAAFAVLAILGIVVDPTTEGVRDSSQAMTYDKPKPYAPPDVPTVDTDLYFDAVPDYTPLHDIPAPTEDDPSVAFPDERPGSGLLDEDD